jgi:aromatase
LSHYQPLTTEKVQPIMTSYDSRGTAPGGLQESAVHVLRSAASPSVLYNLVADVSRWPAILDPVLHVGYSGRSGRAEWFELWVLVGDQVCSWRTRRSLDPDQGRITFEQERTHRPVTGMAGLWEFQPLDDGGSQVELSHWFTVDGGDAERDQVAAAVDHNSTRDLAALCRLATLGPSVNELVFSFSDQVRLPVSAAEAYEFVERSDQWPQVLPHVSRVELTEPQPGVQDMEMDSVTVDGRVHTTRSLRLCFPAERIVFKQLVPPAMLFGHCGAWEFADAEGGSVVTARHTVALNPAAIVEILGPGHNLADARKYLRDALGANSLQTLECVASVGSQAVGA